MTSLEIKQQVDKCHNDLRNIALNTFELNTKATELQNLIFDLQKQCTHKDSLNNFDLDAQNHCVYCRKLVKRN